MKYSQLVTRSTQKGYNYSIGKRIKELMKDLRQKANPHSERRWIWELLQNSKDARYPDGPLNVRIALNDTSATRTLEFRHTGQPFTVEHITFLTEQVSSKDRAVSEKGEPSSSGKFGSGFLTTHLLSERVEIDTVVKELNLPYIKCKLVLDRSPTDVNEIIESVNSSLSVLSAMDDLPPYTGYSPTDFNTTFRYTLDKKGIGVATKGLEDLDIAIPYTLLFVPHFNEIEVTHAEVTYQRQKKTLPLQDNIEVHTIVKSDAVLGEEKIEIVVVRGKQVQLAIPVKKVKGKIVLQPLNPAVPRIFCDFPLVGTEDFPFPAVINSPLFNPNDPRNKILLTDVDEKDILENKALLEEAVILYRQFIDVCQDEKWQQTYLLAAFNDAKKLDWIDGDWFREEVIERIHTHLLTAVLVDTEKHGRKAMEDKEGKIQIWFPSAGDSVVLEKIDALCRPWFAHAMPRKSEMAEWNKVCWKEGTKETLRRLTEDIEAEETLTELQGVLDKGTDAIDWLNEYFDLVNIEGNVIKDIIANKFAIFPDQNGVFKTREGVDFDNSLPEVFKDIFALLGKDIRAELRHKGLYTANKHNENAKDNIKHTVRKLATFYGDLNELLEKADAKLELEASAKLACLFSNASDFPAKRQKIFDCVSRIYPELKMTKVTISSIEDKIWERSDKVLLFDLVMCIANEEELEQFTAAYYFTNKKEAVEWIDGFAKLLLEIKEESYLNNADYPMLPDQNGRFRIKDDLLDGLFVDEDLKDISARLGYDFRDELIDDRIAISFSDSRNIDDSVVIEKIKNLVAGLFSEMREDEDTKEAFRLLFLWFSRNPKQGAEEFGDLYATRHRLIKAEDFEEADKKAKKLTEIMEKNDIEDYDELDRRLQESSGEEKISPTKLPITLEILLSLGVTNEDELIEALKDKNLEELFSHTSIRTHEMFVFVQAKLRRTIENVRAFLSEQEEYDCTNAEPVATSVIGGITKYGQEIYVVARPSDNGEVIFYYGSEKDTLEEPGAECWIENGRDQPRMLTLGHILKVNRINKVKVG
jgi:hypothetical protein